MKTLSFALAMLIATGLFWTFGSAGIPSKATVSTHVATMHAVLPDGQLVELSAIVTSNGEDGRLAKAL